jgi:SAM-dependent methyltransferase
VSAGNLDRCPLCGGQLSVFVERPGVPVHQNIPLESATAARAAARGDLRLACCHSCGFIVNVAFRPELLEYGARYENDQTHSPSFEQHTEALVASLVDEGVRGQFIVDIGCGQGQFLRRLCVAGDNRAVGFDPSYRGAGSIDDGRVTFVREFYTGQPTARPADLVLCRHVLEHVADPMALLGHIRRALGSERSSRLAFEMRSVDWILDGGVVQDLFYEHCSYFTPESLGFAFERAGFSNFAATRFFGGQYLWAVADHSPGQHPAAHPAPERVVLAADRYRAQEIRRIASLRSDLERLRAKGPVAIWGAGAKGVTFLHLADPDGAIVDCTVDVNPRKQGMFVAGTGHPIVSPEEINARGVRHVVVMNPNYIEEVRHAVSAIDATVGVHVGVT